jgi:hypothetical protein
VESPFPLPARDFPKRASSLKNDDVGFSSNSGESNSAESEDSQVEVIDFVQPKSGKGKAKAVPSPLPSSPMVTRNRGRPSKLIMEVEVPTPRKPPGLRNDPMPLSPVPKSGKQRRAARKQAATSKGTKSTKEKSEAPLVATISASPFELPELDVDTLIRVSNEIGDHAIVSHFYSFFSFTCC